MLLLGALTVFLLIALSSIAAYVRRDEIMANWSKYRDNPLYMFAAFMFKPEGDPRSRLTFAFDNFKDVLNGMLTKVFAVFLAPIMKIMQVMMGSLEESANGIMNMRGIFKNMFQKFSSVTNIFQQRYNNTFHSLRVTYTKLQESINKVFGATVASLYAGVSAFRAIDNAFRFMTLVTIAILSVLLVFTVLFFFILFPILPIIAIGLHFVLQTPYAGEVTGMQEAFCFAEHTLLPTTNGPVPIRSIQIGDVLLSAHGESKVLGKMVFQSDYEPLYNLYGVKVSGAHIYYDNGVPRFVKDVAAAVQLPSTSEGQYLYCLITDDHKIPVLSDTGTILFADWEELESDEDLQKWHKTVFAALNPDVPYKAPSSSALECEAAVSASARVFTPLGPVLLRNVHPGTTVLDAQGYPTRVTGVVRLDASLVTAVHRLDEQTAVSAGSWVFEEDHWKQPESLELTAAEGKGETWYMLFTESGSFRLATTTFKDCVLRDFSDVGTDVLPKTYDMVLEALAAGAPNLESD